MSDARHLAFVGLGEGLGNCIMGLPLVDSLIAAGCHVDLSLRPTPPGLAPDLAALFLEGREGALTVVGEGRETWRAGGYGLACLTSWWLSRGEDLPEAAETRVGRPASETEPEILSNLAALPDGVEALATARVVGACRRQPGPHQGPLVAIHPGCKPDPTWRRRKVYPRWAEVVHRLKDLGACVWVVGTEADVDLYAGEPHEDLRGQAHSLVATAQVLSMADVVVSGDSGLHHLAVALGRPTVALFGQSSQEKARHPAPEGPEPVVLGPFETPEHLAGVAPAVIARAACRAAKRARTAVEA